MKIIAECSGTSPNVNITRKVMLNEERAITVDCLCVIALCLQGYHGLLSQSMTTERMYGKILTVCFLFLFYCEFIPQQCPFRLTNLCVSFFCVLQVMPGLRICS